MTASVPQDRTRIAIGLSYDGSGFHGFAPQPGVRTVAGLLTSAMSRLFGHDTSCVCAGRTDAGVHATAQVVHVDVDTATMHKRFFSKDAPKGDLLALMNALNALLGPEIYVWRVVVTASGFDARRSALSRRYRYSLDYLGGASPLRRHVAWQLARPLDLDAMAKAAWAFIGEHDFCAFCRAPVDHEGGPLRRTVLDARLFERGVGRIELEIEAMAFCHQMVRSIMGALVFVGGGEAPQVIGALLASGDRHAAPPPAPPEGLCLIVVRFPEPYGGTWSGTAAEDAS